MYKKLVLFPVDPVDIITYSRYKCARQIATSFNVEYKAAGLL
jgi:hypothetical protein